MSSQNQSVNTGNLSVAVLKPAPQVRYSFLPHGLKTCLHSQVLTTVFITSITWLRLFAQLGILLAWLYKAYALSTVVCKVPPNPERGGSKGG